MKKKKVSFTVEKIVEEHNTKGSKLLKVFIRSNGKQYTKVVRKADYLIEGARMSFHQLWIKTLKEEIEEETVTLEKSKSNEKVLADLVGTEIVDEED